MLGGGFQSNPRHPATHQHPTTQPRITQKPKTTQDKLYLKQISLIILNYKDTN